MSRQKNPEPPYPRQCAQWELLRCPPHCTCLLCQLKSHEPLSSHVLADSERAIDGSRAGCRRIGARPSSDTLNRCKDIALSTRTKRARTRG
jgi:hypothetical protein